MILAPELVALIHRQRTEEMESSRRAVLAARLRACCTASVNVVQRIVRIFRPAPSAC